MRSMKLPLSQLTMMLATATFWQPSPCRQVMMQGRGDLVWQSARRPLSRRSSFCRQAYLASRQLTRRVWKAASSAGERGLSARSRELNSCTRKQNWLLFCATPSPTRVQSAFTMFCRCALDRCSISCAWVRLLFIARFSPTPSRMPAADALSLGDLPCGSKCPTQFPWICTAQQSWARAFSFLSRETGGTPQAALTALMSSRTSALLSSMREGCARAARSTYLGVRSRKSGRRGQRSPEQSGMLRTASPPASLTSRMQTPLSLSGKERLTGAPFSTYLLLLLPSREYSTNRLPGVSSTTVFSSRTAAGPTTWTLAPGCVLRGMGANWLVGLTTAQLWQVALKMMLQGAEKSEVRWLALSLLLKACEIWMSVGPLLNAQNWSQGTFSEDSQLESRKWTEKPPCEKITCVSAGCTTSENVQFSHSSFPTSDSTAEVSGVGARDTTCPMKLGATVYWLIAVNPLPPANTDRQYTPVRFSVASTEKAVVFGCSHWLKASRVWSDTRVKMTLTMMPVGLATVMMPLNGKISFFRKVAGTPCDSTMPVKEVVLVKAVCVTSGRPAGVDMSVLFARVGTAGVLGVVGVTVGVVGVGGVTIGGAGLYVLTGGSAFEFDWGFEAGVELGVA